MKYSILTVNGALIRYTIRENSFDIVSTNRENENIRVYDFNNAFMVSKALTKCGCLNMVVPADEALTIYKNLLERGEDESW